MKIAIIGAGGVGGYFGAMLFRAKHELLLIARGAHLQALQAEGLHVSHPHLHFHEHISVCDLEGLWHRDPSTFDLVILLTKSMETHAIAQGLARWFEGRERLPYALSLQNGVENEQILTRYLPKNRVIGGLTRKIGAHVITPGSIEAVGEAQTIIGALCEDERTHAFVMQIADDFNGAGIPTVVSGEIEKELWKKLIINNGVNALCALLRVKTGVLMHHPELSQLVLGLMRETARAARALHVSISDEDVDAMFELILGFDSIKPSMLIDVEHGRALEREEICGVVIRTLEKEGEDAPYTRTISTLLAYTISNG